MSDTPKRVLSIQSHVVSGYVGNKTATFPLHLFGYDVDPLLTVQFSNHTGYAGFKGRRTTPEELRELYQGLKENLLTVGTYSHLLVGYIGLPESLQVVNEIIDDLCKTNPNIQIVIDPVMGDDGSYYVQEAALPFYRDQICPKAHMILPNQFEAEKLTGRSIGSLEEAKEVTGLLHDLGPRHVVLTSITFPTEPETLYILGSSAPGMSGREGAQAFYIAFPRLKGWFTGSGDLFSSLILARFHQEGDLIKACELTVASVQAILHRTQNKAQNEDALATRRGAHPLKVRACELALIPGRGDLENPTVKYTCIKY
ncbi:MAG: pyridoxal kinase [Piptocephalis tieghemiana]|nr:MAG: pyridoxal kinase [Piptocephalis tieghemiana]